MKNSSEGITHCPLLYSSLLAPASPILPFPMSSPSASPLRPSPSRSPSPSHKRQCTGERGDSTEETDTSSTSVTSSTPTASHQQEQACVGAGKDTQAALHLIDELKPPLTLHRYGVDASLLSAVSARYKEHEKADEEMLWTRYEELRCAEQDPKLYDESVYQPHTFEDVMKHIGVELLADPLIDRVGVGATCVLFGNSEMAVKNELFRDSNILRSLMKEKGLYHLVAQVSSARNLFNPLPPLLHADVVDCEHVTQLPNCYTHLCRKNNMHIKCFYLLITQRQGMNVKQMLIKQFNHARESQKERESESERARLQPSEENEMVQHLNEEKRVNQQHQAEEIQLDPSSSTRSISSPSAHASSSSSSSSPSFPVCLACSSLSIVLSLARCGIVHGDARQDQVVLARGWTFNHTDGTIQREQINTHVDRQSNFKLCSPSRSPSPSSTAVHSSTISSVSSVSETSMKVVAECYYSPEFLCVLDLGCSDAPSDEAEFLDATADDAEGMLYQVCGDSLVQTEEQKLFNYDRSRQILIGDAVTNLHHPHCRFARGKYTAAEVVAFILDNENKHKEEGSGETIPIVFT